MRPLRPLRQSSIVICLNFILCWAAFINGCTATTTVRTHTPAFQADDDSSEAGGRLNSMSTVELLANGNALLAEGKYGMARLYFLTTIERDPRNSIAYVGLGDLDFRTGNYQSALSNYRKASAHDQANLLAVLGQAQILREQGDFDAATEQLNRAVQIAPNDVRVLAELAINYSMQGQETLAEPLFKELAVKSPDTAATFNNIGVNELTRGNYAFAIVNLSKAYMLDSKNERIINNLAMAFALYNQEDQALKLYTKTVGEAAAWNNIGYLHMTMKRFDEAERSFRKALDINPKFYVRAKENLDQLNRLRQMN